MIQLKKTKCLTFKRKKWGEKFKLLAKKKKEAYILVEANKQKAELLSTTKGVILKYFYYKRDI